MSWLVACQMTFILIAFPDTQSNGFLRAIDSVKLQQGAAIVA
jgi:hypothetical protein